MLRIVLTLVMIGLLVAGGIFLFVAMTQKKGAVESAQDTIVEEADPAPPLIKQIEKEKVILVENSGFNPAELTVRAYEKIIWDNQTDSTIYIEHYPEEGQQKYLPFTLGETPAEKSVSTSFIYKRRYRYWDRYHPTRIGFLTVE